jgi:hypothetical protein
MTYEWSEFREAQLPVKRHPRCGCRNQGAVGSLLGKRRQQQSHKSPEQAPAAQLRDNGKQAELAPAVPLRQMAVEFRKFEGQ